MIRLIKESGFVYISKSAVRFINFNNDGKVEISFIDGQEAQFHGVREIDLGKE